MDVTNEFRWFHQKPKAKHEELFRQFGLTDWSIIMEAREKVHIVLHLKKWKKTREKVQVRHTRWILETLGAASLQRARLSNSCPKDLTNWWWLAHSHTSVYKLMAREHGVTLRKRVVKLMLYVWASLPLALSLEPVPWLKLDLPWQVMHSIPNSWACQLPITIAKMFLIDFFKKKNLRKGTFYIYKIKV